MPYSSGESIKECIVSAVNILSNNVTHKQQQMFIKQGENVRLSSDTVTRRTKSIATKVKEYLLENVSLCRFFCFAIDESRTFLL
jgi:hypothetical protein